MLDILARWLPAFDPVTGTVALPVWATAAAATALIGLICLFAFTRAGREGSIGALARFVLMGLVALATWIGLESYGRDTSAERRALDARLTELTARALMPGSPLACLDATAGDAVEALCEKSVFATPEATAAAVSYVSAQLSLLADATEYVRLSGASYDALTNLRHAAELDRFGLVARVLAVRDGCTPQQCRAFAFLHDPSRVRANLGTGTYDLYVIRHLANWPAVPGSPAATASAAPSAPPGSPAPVQPTTVASTVGSVGTAAPPTKMPLASLFFPSSASIPPINIMNPEPTGPESKAAGDQSGKTPASSRKPAAAATAAHPPVPPPRRPPLPPPLDTTGGTQGAAPAKQ